MSEEKEKAKSSVCPKKITSQRLKNIALYYLKRFDSSVENLRQVLRRRVLKYARFNPEWDKAQAFVWIEQILNDFERYGYLDDARYTELKVKSYLSAGKSARYIVGKLKQKGICESVVQKLLENQEYDAFTTALYFAEKKKIGPFRPAETRHTFRQKDMGTLLRAGFDYDTVRQVLAYEV